MTHPTSWGPMGPDDVQAVLRSMDRIEPDGATGPLDSTAGLYADEPQPKECGHGLPLTGPRPCPDCGPKSEDPCDA